MPDEPPDRPATTAARVRFVLGRMLAPWVWGLTVVGAALWLAPGDVYFTPSPEGERTHRAETVRAETGGMFVYAGAPNSWGSVAIDNWHLRSVILWATGAEFTLPKRSGEPSASEPTAAERRWVGRWNAPAWGLGVERSFVGDLGPDETYPSPAGGAASRVVGIQIGVVWLAGVPLLWTLFNLLRGLRNGWQAADRVWQRTVRPWRWTAAATGGVVLLLGPGIYPGGMHQFGDDFALMATVRNDRFSPWHPRGMRFVIEYPTPPSSAGTESHWPAHPSPFNIGDRTEGLQLVRSHGLKAGSLIHVSYENPFDVPSAGRTQLALDLSLWYVLLPAALWSGVVLWRSRAGRMRPA